MKAQKSYAIKECGPEKTKYKLSLECRAKSEDKRSLFATIQFRIFCLFY
jgi:hypothetical protein